MKIICTTAEANTLRAAFSTHRDRASDAIVKARRSRDAEHVASLERELANIASAMKNMSVVE